jgi:hypothetical protein
MDDYDVAFRQAWAADFNPTGEKLQYWDKGAWPLEGGGYWFDGLVRLAYALHDDDLLKQAKARLDAVATHMNPNSILFVWWLNRNNPVDMSEKGGVSDGFPSWASGLLGRALVAYYAASNDPRILQTLQWGYDADYNWLLRSFTQTSIDPAFETYTWTGNKKIQASLTELFEKGVNKNQPGEPVEIGMPFTIRMPNDKSPWYDQAGYYMCNDGGWKMIKQVHGVHFNELASPWALAYLWTGKREYLDAVRRYYELADRDSMQPYGVMVADELCGPAGASRGTETCDVPAYMWSQIQLLRISGEGIMGDRLERAFFNAAPGTVSRDFKSHVYIQMANRVTPVGGDRDYKRIHWPLCCTASVSRALPYYVTHMWMATYDNGLAATSYGPNKVTALVGDQVPVELVSRTDYPFGESIDIAVKPARPSSFPLSFRIPGWCKNPRIAVNGASVDVAFNGRGFVRIERRWKPGDRIHLQFPMAPRVVAGRDANAGGAPYATVQYGPLAFVLPIADLKDGNTPDPAAQWKFALDTTGASLGSGITVERGAMPARWNWPLASPLKLLVPAEALDWNGTALPAKPGATAQPPRNITLVPYGCTSFRVSFLPITERTAKAAGLDQPGPVAGK